MLRPYDDSSEWRPAESANGKIPIMKRIKLVLDEIQWALAKGILEEAGIPFSILNEQFSSLYPGPAVGAFGREILVAEEDEEQARDLLAEFFN